MMGRTPKESIEIFRQELNIPASTEEILNLRNQFMREKLTHELQPMPGLFEFLDEFKNKVKLAIATSAQEEFLQLVVRQLNIRQIFEVLQSSDSILHGKPHPEIYLKTCSLLQLHPSQCLVLEDSENGVIAGNQAGCQVIAIPNLHTQKHNFSPAVRIVKNLQEAKELILKNY
jgi:HAD superfamily hydrolase (TIGR01509 family)